MVENNVSLQMPSMTITDEDLNTSTSYLEDPNEFEKVKQYKHILVSNLLPFLLINLTETI